jgi:hypothetical protein
MFKKLQSAALLLLTISKLFTKHASKHHLQKTLKMPSYEGLGWLRWYNKLWRNEITSYRSIKVSLTGTNCSTINSLLGQQRWCYRSW